MSYQFFFQGKNISFFLFVCFLFYYTVRFFSIISIFWQAIVLVRIAEMERGKVRLYLTLTCWDDNEIVGRVCQPVYFVLEIINNFVQDYRAFSIIEKEFVREYCIPKCKTAWNYISVHLLPASWKTAWPAHLIVFRIINEI